MPSNNLISFLSYAEKELRTLVPVAKRAIAGSVDSFFCDCLQFLTLFSLGMLDETKKKRSEEPLRQRRANSIRDSVPESADVPTVLFLQDFSPPDGARKPIVVPPISVKSAKEVAKLSFGCGPFLFEIQIYLELLFILILVWRHLPVPANTRASPSFSICAGDPNEYNNISAFASFDVFDRLVGVEKV